MIAIYTTVLLGLFGNLGSHRSPHDITGWTQLGKTLPAQISQAEPIGAKPRSDLLHIAVSLPYRDPVGMQQFVDSVSDPKSPDYRHFVTPEEVGRRFGLPSSAVQKVVDYLRSVGMQVRLQGKNHLSVLADATVAQVQKAFLTPISLFKVAPSGPMDSGIRFSATSPPSIPSEIAPYVLDVSGLENFTRPRSLGISPAQAKVLYSVAPIFNGGSQGQGRTVAISSFDGFRLANEIAQCETFGLPVPVDGAGTNVSVRSISGGTGQSNYQMSEGDLDIDLAISMAPLCNLIIYDNSEPSGSYDYVGLLTTEADDNSADIVTESYIWVWDSLTQLSAHNLHLSMSAQGITYMAASGDHGTNYFYNPLNEYAAYPMMDPEVLTVGGTTATIDSAGNRISEIGWNGQGDSGGGGWAPTSDPFNVRPGYQLTPLFLAGPGVPSKATSPYRLIPDVALNSDLNTGFLICFNGNVGPAYGTSTASPTFAGAFADCEQQLIADGFLSSDLSGNYRMGRIQDLLYSFNGDPSVFYDITVGANGNLPNGVASVAGPGWDTDTGWGAMIFTGFVSKFENTPQVRTLTFSPNSMVGGNSCTGTVSLVVAAPPGGVTVSLTTVGSDVQVPSSVLIPAGATSATFTVSSNGVVTTEPNDIVAKLPFSSATGTVTLLPAAFTSLTLAPTSVVGGASATGTVNLNGAAPSHGLTVKLSSSNVNATVPFSITVPAGSNSATFSVQTVPVSSSWNATINATIGTTTQTAILAIQAPSLQNLSLTPTAVVGGSQTQVTGTLNLTSIAAASGDVVNLTSSDPLAATVPSSVTVQPGATAATFSVTTIPVLSTRTATITATFNGASQTAILTVSPFTVASITLNPTSLVGGAASTAVVSISQPPASSLTLAITSSSTNATVPPSIVVSPGSQTANFTVTTSGVSANTTASITAAIGSSTQSAQLSIRAATVQNLVITPSSIVGGSTGSVLGTVTLSGPPGVGGDLVTLTSSNPSAAMVPASVSVSNSSGIATFAVITPPVASAQTLTITATFNGTSQTSTLTIVPLQVATLSINPAKTNGGNVITGTVTLSQPVGVSGIVVSLASNGPDASVPASVAIPNGSSSATFPITTRGVAKSETLTVTATLGSSLQVANLILIPAALANLTLSPPTLVGGASSSGVIGLSGVAPLGGLVVNLASSSSAAVVPKSISIPAGANSASFTVSTHGVTTSTSATITANLAGSSSQSAALTVLPSTILSVAVVPQSVIGGSDISVSGTVTFTGLTGSTGDIVTLTSSNPKAATVPTSVRIPPGASSASFSVSHLAVTNTQVATISATYNGVSQSATLVVNPFQITGLSISPTTIQGGMTAAGTVTLNAAPGPRNGAVIVKLNSSLKAASVPLTMLVPAGMTNGKFTINSSAISVPATATISATLNSESQQANLSILAPALSSFSVSPTSVKGSSSTKVVGTITLSGPAPSGGIAVTVSSSNSTAASPPSNVIVPAGKSSVTFTVPHAKVSAPTTATITVSLNGVAKLASLAVTP